MNVLDATRKWLRDECPLIDRGNRFNANYLGADATEYTLRTSGESHRQNLWGADIATHDLVFEAVMPYGTATAPNIAAADFLPGFRPGCGVQRRPTTVPPCPVMRWTA